MCLCVCVCAADTDPAWMYRGLEHIVSVAYSKHMPAHTLDSDLGVCCRGPSAIVV